MNQTELVQKFKTQFLWIEKGFFYTSITLFIHFSLTGIKHLVLLVKDYLVIKEIIKENFNILFAVSEVGESLRWLILSYIVYLILNYTRTRKPRLSTLNSVAKILIVVMLTESIAKFILYAGEAYTFYFKNSIDTILSINPTFHMINFFYFTYPFAILFVAYFIHVLFKFWSFQVSQASNLPLIEDSPNAVNTPE